MTVQTGDFIRWGIQFPFFIFHVSVTAFIFVKILKNKTPYNSTFFKLYLMVSISDIFNIIVLFGGVKMLLFNDLKTWFKSNLWFHRTMYILSGFFFYTQCILHTAIAVNRIWTAFMHFRKTSFLSKFGRFIFWFLPLIPVCILIPRFDATAIYIDGADNEIHPKYENPVMQVYTSTTALLVISITSILSLIFAIATIFRYRYLLNRIETNRQKIMLDFRLFIQALTLFSIQLLFAFRYIMLIIAVSEKLPDLEQFALAYYTWVNDIFCLLNPIVLLIVSKTIRWDYFDFIFWQRFGNNSVKIISIH